MIGYEQRQQIGNYLAGLRGQQGLTQEQLGEKAGVSVKAIYNVEHGQYARVPQSLRKMCDALGVSDDDLDGLDGVTEAEAVSDTEILLDTLRSYPIEVRSALLIAGAWLSRMPPEQRARQCERIIVMTLRENSGE